MAVPATHGPTDEQTSHDTAADKRTKIDAKAVRNTSWRERPDIFESVLFCHGDVLFCSRQHSPRKFASFRDIHSEPLTFTRPHLGCFKLLINPRLPLIFHNRLGRLAVSEVWLDGVVVYLH